MLLLIIQPRRAAVWRRLTGGVRRRFRLTRATSNNNDFFGTTIFTDGTNTFPTIGGYKTFVAPRDTASFAELPPFLSTSGASANFLHISPLTATQLESGGSPVSGISDDFDGQTRNAGTPDVGADEFAGILADLSAPTITYTNLSNTGQTTNRTLTATITDATGVASGANSPRIYYRRVISGTPQANYVSNACTMTSGTAMNGVYSCVIDYTIGTIGTPATGDAVQYFVVAQDTVNPPNLGSNPAGATGADVNNLTAFPTTPNSYSILNTYTGSYSVGTDQTITSLTNAGGLFERINNGTVSGNVIVNLTTDLTAETGAVALNQTNEEGAGGYTITIQSASAAVRTISGGSTTALINFNGADRVTFNGAANGTFGLIVRNTSATTGAVFQWTNDASNNAINNCVIEGGNTSTSSALILFGAGTTTGNDNNTVSNSVVRERTDIAGVPANLIASLNGSTTATNSNNVINANQLTNFTSNAFAASAALTSDNWTITNNDISQTAARTTTIFGLNLGGMTGTNTVSDNLIHGFNTNGTNTSLGVLIGNSQNLTVSRNRIYDFQTTTGATGLIAGIQFGGASGATPSATIINNFVSIAPSLATAQSIIGIRDYGYSGNVFTAYYNSIYVGGTASGSASSWALQRGDLAPTTFTARDNIAFNNRTGGTGSHFAVGDQSANTGTFVSDYNIFVGTGATAANFFDYGTSATGTPVNFAAWKTGPPIRDTNSKASNPTGDYTLANFFNSATDLHLKTTGTNPAVGAGTPITGITTDIDLDARPALNPDIGADQTNSVNLSVSSNTGSEAGQTVITVTATASQAVTSAKTVDLTVTGTGITAGDYTLSNTTITIPAGQTSGSVTFTVVDDALVEGTETAVLTISNPSSGISLGAVTTQNITITDNDFASVNLSVSSNTGSEMGQTAITVTATASQPVVGDQTVSLDVSGVGITAGDYTLSNTTITIPNGQTSGSVTFTVVDDALIEGTETAILTISNPSAGVVLGATTTQNITIADNDYPSVNLSVSSNTASETGQTTITVMATASQAVVGDQTVDLNVSGAGITAGDYNLSGTTITIPNGQTSGSVIFTVVDDALIEGTETATLSIGNPSAGIILGATTMQNVSIADNDYPSVNLSVDSNTGSEAGMTTITVTATASQAVVGDQTVDLNVSGTGITAGDYTLSGATITIPNGQTTGSVTFTIVDDALIEGMETATLTINNPSSGIVLGATVMQNISITDNDYPAVNLSVSSNTGSEAGATVITVTATASQAVVGDQTVSLNISGTGITAGDYTLSNAIITIPDGQTTGSVTFTVVDDGLIEGTETAVLTISNPSAGIVLGATTTQNISIADNDYPAVNLSVSSNTASETGMTVITVTATASQAVVGNQTVDLAVSGAGITVGDYTLSSMTITILDGQTTGTVAFTVVDDALIEGMETAILTISNPSAGIILGLTTSQNVTITDNDFPSVNLSVSATAGSEAAATSITVTATASQAVVGDQTVSLNVSGTGITAGDYTLSSQTITILDGQTTGTATFTIVDDAVVEGTETAILTISNPSAGIVLGTTTTQNVTITDNDFPSVNLSVSANSGTEAGATAITVTATASDPVIGDQTVSVGVSGTGITAGDYTLSNATITIPNGQTSGSVTFTIVNDTLYEGNETAVLTISNPSAGITLGTTVTQNVSIIDDDPAPTLTINNVSQTEGNSGTTTFTFTVTSSAALEMPITVNYATADGTATTPGDYTAVTNGTVTIAASSTTGSATVLVNGDTTVEPDETFTVTLSNPVNATIASGTGTGTIQNDDIPTITVSPATLPDGTVGVAYNQTITASGGASPYMFSFTGNLPTGLTLSTSGILSGTPTMAGTYNFTVTATDSSNYTGSQAYTVMISVPDTTAPTVGYTALTATNDTLNRVLPVEIDDNIGVSSGANAPRIYYRKGTSDYVSTQCSLSGTTPNYNCTIDYAVLGGAAAGDFISYFVVAQDDAGNITSNPAGAAGNVNGLILPANFAPNGYAIGSANIPAGTYTSLESNDANVVGAVMVLANMKLNGIVKVTSGGLLTFDCGSTVTGAGETVFVTGNVRKNFCTNQSPDNTFTFPVGSNAFGQSLAENNRRTACRRVKVIRR